MVSKRFFCTLARGGGTQKLFCFLSGNPMFGNDYDKPMSAGIYLYQIQAGEYLQTKKMVLLK